MKKSIRTRATSNAVTVFQMQCTNVRKEKNDRGLIIAQKNHAGLTMEQIVCIILVTTHSSTTALLAVFICFIVGLQRMKFGHCVLNLIFTQNKWRYE